MNIGVFGIIKNAFMLTIRIVKINNIALWDMIIGKIVISIVLFRLIEYVI